MTDYGARRPWRRIPGGTEVRHEVAPLPMSCRWCGIPERGHCQRWVRGKSWHGWMQPTRAQVEARLRAKLARERREREKRRGQQGRHPARSGEVFSPTSLPRRGA